MPARMGDRTSFHRTWTCERSGVKEGRDGLEERGRSDGTATARL